MAKKLSYERYTWFHPQQHSARAMMIIQAIPNLKLDKDLALLYGVETKALNRAVKRNLGRFPDDFMFQLTAAEFVNLRFQFGTSSWGG